MFIYLLKISLHALDMITHCLKKQKYFLLEYMYSLNTLD